MAGYPNFLSTPNQSLTGNVLDPSKQQNPDGQITQVELGRQGDLLVSEIHDPFYNVAARGRLFVAYTSAGSLVLAPGQTTSGLMLQNPTGSGVNLEVIEVSVVPTTATDVVGAISLEYGAPYTTLGTKITANPMLVGGNAQTAQGICSKGSTIVAMTLLLPMYFMQSTGGIMEGLPVYRPRGLVIAPGGAINMVSTVTQSTNVDGCAYIWAEWPV